MLTLTTAQQAALAAGPTMIGLYRLDHPDGAIRMSTLPFDWTDNDAVTWIGGGALLAVSDATSQIGDAGASLTVTLSAADAALVATARETDANGRNKIEGVRLRLWVAIVGGDPLLRIGDALQQFDGVAEAPVIDADPQQPTISVTAESRILRLNRRRPFRLDDAYQQEVFAGDTGFSLIPGLQDAEPFA